MLASHFCVVQDALVLFSWLLLRSLNVDWLPSYAYVLVQTQGSRNVIAGAFFPTAVPTHVHFSLQYCKREFGIVMAVCNGFVLQWRWIWLSETILLKSVSAPLSTWCRFIFFLLMGIHYTCIPFNPFPLSAYTLDRRWRGRCRSCQDFFLCQEWRHYLSAMSAAPAFAITSHVSRVRLDCCKWIFAVDFV